MTPSPSVLVVEDDDDIRASLTEFLDDHGYLARSAANGSEGLAVLAEGFRPCVIILDLMMPVMDGWTFRAEQLRRPDVSKAPVVVISAYKDVASRIKDLTVAACLPKPIDLDALLTVMRAHCAASP